MSLDAGTHNRRMMSSTDVIYGITMVEKGISRVVPADLRELGLIHYHTRKDP